MDDAGILSCGGERGGIINQHTGGCLQLGIKYRIFIIDIDINRFLAVLRFIVVHVHVDVDVDVDVDSDSDGRWTNSMSRDQVRYPYLL